MIEIKQLAKRFGAQVILDGVDLTVQEGETMALLGPSGTGKSVLLKHIIGLIRPDAGEVIVDGQNVATLGRKELSALRSTSGWASPSPRSSATRRSPRRGWPSACGW